MICCLCSEMGRLVSKGIQQIPSPSKEGHRLIGRGTDDRAATVTSIMHTTADRTSARTVILSLTAALPEFDGRDQGLREALAPRATPQSIMDWPLPCPVLDSCKRLP
jgi:hypothetical protein